MFLSGGVTLASQAQLAMASPPASPDSNLSSTVRGTIQQPVSLAACPAQFTYGNSVQGRPLIGYTFGSGPNKTIIQACIHGNERNTFPLAQKLIAYLKANPDSYAGCTVTVLPCLNPDGWARGTRVNAHNVDLNRNFPAGWKPSVRGKLSRGSGPLSEPEAAALARLIQKLMPAKIVSIHNPLHMLDHSGPGGKELAEVLAAHDGYPVPSGGVGYPTPGSFGQFASGLGISVVTLELPRESTDNAWKQNEGALVAAIQWSRSTTQQSKNGYHVQEIVASRETKHAGKVTEKVGTWSGVLTPGK